MWALTMQELKATRCQVSMDAGKTWREVTDGELGRILERSCTFPDDARQRIANGVTVRLDRTLSYYARRRPNTNEAADARRQAGLFGPRTVA